LVPETKRVGQVPRWASRQRDHLVVVLAGFRGVENVVPLPVGQGLPDVEHGVHARGAHRTVHAHRVREVQVAGSAGEKRGRKAVKVSVHRGEQRIHQVASSCVELDGRVDHSLARPEAVVDPLVGEQGVTGPGQVGRRRAGDDGSRQGELLLPRAKHRGERQAAPRRVAEDADVFPPLRLQQLAVDRDGIVEGRRVREVRRHAVVHRQDAEAGEPRHQDGLSRARLTRIEDPCSAVKMQQDAGLIPRRAVARRHPEGLHAGDGRRLDGDPERLAHLRQLRDGPVRGGADDGLPLRCGARDLLPVLIRRFRDE